MKKQIIYLFLICITLLIGCSKKSTFDDYFHESMKEMNKGEKDYSYSLIHNEFNIVHENDAIAVFIENKGQDETIFIAYYEKYDIGEYEIKFVAKHENGPVDVVYLWGKN